MRRFLKKAILFVLFLIMIILTLKSAIAFELDDIEDEFLLTRGDSAQGSFIIESYAGALTLSTDFEWISFRDGIRKRYLESEDGAYLTEDAVFFPYYIEIPDNADVGIYRTTIEVSDGIDAKYLNVKIQVKPAWYVGFMDTMKNPTIPMVFFASIGGLIVLFIALKVLFFGGFGR